MTKSEAKQVITYSILLWYSSFTCYFFWGLWYSGGEVTVTEQNPIVRIAEFALHLGIFGFVVYCFGTYVKRRRRQNEEE